MKIAFKKMLVVCFKVVFENTGLAFSVFMFTDFSSRCLCSALSPAGPKDLFSLHVKLFTPVPALGGSSEQCSPSVPSESAPCCAVKHVPYRNTVSSLYKEMASFQNFKQAVS